MNKLYSVHDHWTDINKKNDVDIESIDGVITGIKVNGEDYGGGGSSWQTVFEGSVTTTSEEEETPWAELTEVADLSADTIKVTFNGVEYTCEKKQITLSGYSYGAPFGKEDWSEYPFRIDINPKMSSIMTETAGTYPLKIEEEQSGGSVISVRLK